MAPKRVLLISNGHGEDLSGSLIGQELVAHGAEVAALPLVGHGNAYRQAGIQVLGRTRTYSTGGLGYTSLAGRLTELLQGQVSYVLRRLALFLCQARHFDLVVVIGDVLPVVAAWLSCRPVVTYLVAYSSHYEGRLRLPWPCGWCLRSGRFQRVYSRDSLTATDLTAQLGRPVHFLGNPFLDRAREPAPPLQPLEPHSSPGARLLGLLPGSRLPEALRNLELMLKVLVRLPPSWQQQQRLELVAALVKDLHRELVGRCAAPLGWTLQGDRLERGPLVLHLVWGGFAAVVQQSDLLLSMTGTAAEQAVGLGKPVLQLVGHGPQFTVSFAEAQRRLLGSSLACSDGEPGSEGSLAGTAELATGLLTALADPAFSERCRRNGHERIGGPGGAARMAREIHAVLSDV